MIETMTDAEIWDELEAEADAVAEIKSEIAAFGDGPVGSAARVDRFDSLLAEARRRANVAAAAKRAAAPVAPLDPDDIPF